MTSAFLPRFLGRSGILVSPIGLGSSYGLSGRDVERAFDRGVSFFLWGARRRASFGAGLRQLAKGHREDVAIAIQTYTRVASLMDWSVDRALRSLETDYVDLLTLSYWNGPIPERILDAALRLRESGKVRNIMASGHHRPSFARFLGATAVDSIMVRYNAAHPGAERDVWPFVERAANTDPSGRRPGVVTFTATRWGTLLDRRLLPPNEPAPRASDCYRFALTSPFVNVTLAGPKDARELDEAIATIERGPMNAEELAWMRRVGAHVREATAKPRVGLLTSLIRPRKLSGSSSLAGLPPTS